MDAAINLGGTFGFVTCRSVHVVFVALLIGCLGISWLSLSLSACLIPQYSFLSVDSERSSLLSFDMLEFISIGLVSAVKFRPCCVFRMDPIMMDLVCPSRCIQVLPWLLFHGRPVPLLVLRSGYFVSFSRPRRLFQCFCRGASRCCCFVL